MIINWSLWTVSSDMMMQWFVVSITFNAFMITYKIHLKGTIHNLTFHNLIICFASSSIHIPSLFLIQLFLIVWCKQIVSIEGPSLVLLHKLFQMDAYTDWLTPSSLYLQSASFTTHFISAPSFPHYTMLAILCLRHRRARKQPPGGQKDDQIKLGYMGNSLRQQFS